MIRLLSKPWVPTGMTNEQEQLCEEFLIISQSDFGTRIFVRTIEWDGPYTPIENMVLATEIDGEPTENELQEAILKVLSNRRFFSTCKECGELNPKGRMHDHSICPSCAQLNHGVLY